MDTLTAFGAKIVVKQLPESEKWIPPVFGVVANQSDDDVDLQVELPEAEEEIERPYRLKIHNREAVTGPVLVEIDQRRNELIEAFRWDLGKSEELQNKARKVIEKRKPEGLENPTEEFWNKAIKQARQKEDMWMFRKAIRGWGQTWMNAIKQANEKEDSA
jgi:hypothetical protein